MFSDPIKVVESIGIVPGMEVADFGAGSGHYVLSTAKLLMSSGRVYAVDIQKDLLTKLKNVASKQGLYNIEVVWGDVEKPNGTKLRDSSIDLVFLSNIMFQLEKKEDAIKEAKRILKPDGKICVIDWSDSFNGLGPQPKMVFTKDKAVSMFGTMGFAVDREVSAGSHHYGIIFKKM